jgi:hypothetical protein
MADPLRKCPTCFEPGKHVGFKNLHGTEQAAHSFAISLGTLGMRMKLGNVRIAAIKDACEFFAAGDNHSAAKAIALGYPFTPLDKAVRNYTSRAMTKVSFRDGFMTGKGETDFYLLPRCAFHRTIFPVSCRSTRKE